MASVPVSMEQLESITAQVAEELLEEWAINDRFTEDQIENARSWAIDDTVLIVNSFMEKFNTAMLEQAEEKKLII
jgi:3-deoxy-D-arabino-heptulosonate 7-phosphate (DAHP) synthase